MLSTDFSTTSIHYQSIDLFEERSVLPLIKSQYMIVLLGKREEERKTTTKKGCANFHLSLWETSSYISILPLIKLVCVLKFNCFPEITVLHCVLS